MLSQRAPGDRALERGKHRALPVVGNRNRTRYVPSMFEALARTLRCLSGEDVTGLTPYSNTELDPTGVLGLTNPGWGGQVPLWFGILQESALAENGRRLGPTGRQIVAEVILGLIDADKESYFHAAPAWAPAGGTFGIADLLRIAGAL
jgi:hypothetical protein